MNKHSLKSPQGMKGIILLLELSLLLCAFLLVISQVNWVQVKQEWQNLLQVSQLACPAGQSGTCTAQYANGVITSSSCTCS